MFGKTLFSLLGTLLIKPFTTVFNAVTSAVGWKEKVPEVKTKPENPVIKVENFEAEKGQVRLALDYLHRYGELIDDEGRPVFHRLSGWKRLVCPKSRIRRFELGQPIDCKHRSILVIGDPEDTLEWIDGLINHILGVEWDDPFRFQLMEDLSRSRSCSFTLHRTPGMKVHCSLTLICCNIINFAKTLEELEEINAVCFVTSPESNPSLVKELTYQLSSFDPDMKSIIKWIVTSHNRCAESTTETPLETSWFYSRMIYEDNTIQKYEDGWMNIEYDQRLTNWREQARTFDSLLSDIEKAEPKSLEECHRILRAKESLKKTMRAVEDQLELCKMKKASLGSLEKKIRIFEAEVEGGPACYMKRVIGEWAVKEVLPHGMFTYFCLQCNISCERLTSNERCKFEQKIPTFWRSCNSNTCTCPGHRHTFKKVDIRRVSSSDPEWVPDKLLKEEYDERCNRLYGLVQLSTKLRDELSSTENLLLELVQKASRHMDIIRSSSLYIPTAEAEKSVFDILDDAFDQCQTPLPSSKPGVFDYDNYRDELIHRLREWTVTSDTIAYL